MIGMVLAGAGALAAGAAAVTYAVRAAVPAPSGRHRAAPAGVMPTGFRYCPAELRTRAATPHPDGSATCDGCGTHIPAHGEAPDA